MRSLIVYTALVVGFFAFLPGLAGLVQGAARPDLVFSGLTLVIVGGFFLYRMKEQKQFFEVVGLSLVAPGLVAIMLFGAGVTGFSVMDPVIRFELLRLPYVLMMSGVYVVSGSVLYWVGRSLP